LQSNFFELLVLFLSPAMAVHTSLARCVRATPSSTTLFRPMPSSSARGQLYQVYQRAGYASDNGSDSSKPTNSTPDSPSQQAPAGTSPKQPETSSILDKLNLGENAGDSTTDQAAKLAARMEDIRSKMKELSQPAKFTPSSRSFFGLQQGHKKLNLRSKPNAEAEAERTLESLSKRRSSPSSSSPRQAQEQEQDPQQEQSLVRKVSPSSMVRNNVDGISPPPRLKPIAMKLGTKLGRQILVQNEKGIDCAGAIRSLQIQCNVNGVRRQANLQKFHVRRGQMRKDLKSQRWRRLFKFSFEETVKKIQRMRDQGW
jgi:small subunit ribosomal protein MRP21